MALESLVRSFLNKTFPINTYFYFTPKGSISTKALTPAILQALGNWHGARGNSNYSIPNTSFGLEADYEIPLPSCVTIAVESQLSQREPVFFDILKHAELQKRGKSNVLVELIPDDTIAARISLAAAATSWTRTMVKTIVLPYLKPNAVKFVIVPIDLVPV